MKIFVDANILVAVLNKEYPIFPYAARVLSLTANKNYDIITSPVCLSIAFYFAEKRFNAVIAKQKINLLVKHISIANCGEKEVKSSIANKKIHDFEDGVQYYAAINSKCNTIVTENINDFYFSDIEVLTCESFLKNHFK